MGSPVVDIAILTHFLSPYQAELFNEISNAGHLSIRVHYLHRSHHTRYWSNLKLSHQAVFLREGTTAVSEAMSDFETARLAILNYYNERIAQKLIRCRSKTGMPWVFWGERPRHHFYYLASRVYRHLRLRALHRSNAPIWGIGRLAVEGYRREFGPRRTYANIPYFSNLERFSKSAASAPARPSRERTILYSGSLISRKGVDHVAAAFARIIKDGLRAKLIVLGSGPLEQMMREHLSNCLDRVEFVGFRDWETLPDLYAISDILCVPSRYDGWGLVVPEGLAAGLPVISTTQTGAAMEFIRPGRNGWLVPPDNEEAVYRAMRQAVTLTDTQWREMSGEAIHSVATHTLAHGAQRFIAAALDAIDAWKSSPSHDRTLGHSALR
jgi:glycosyltransferase involved in cell wall biosynthesis